MNAPTAAAPAIPTVAAHGAAIPALGFGTSPQTGAVAAEEVVAALRAGYRHIDTARKYGSERAVGEAIRASGVPRSEIFLVTKVSHENLRAADFARSVDESLKALRVDYVDLLMVHWPNPAISLSETMPALAKAKRDGLARHIGVANFTTRLLDEAIALCPEPLVALQAEYHPYLDQSKLLGAVRRHGLAFVAYCPLGRGRLFSDPALAEIARARGRSVAQVALRWLVQQGVIPIPRSSKPERIAGNLNVFDFSLADDEMRRISALKRPDGRIANPVERIAGGWD
jgi:2,5-diketo-D-gluconate reductase B